MCDSCFLKNAMLLKMSQKIQHICWGGGCLGLRPGWPLCHLGKDHLIKNLTYLPGGPFRPKASGTLIFLHLRGRRSLGGRSGLWHRFQGRFQKWYLCSIFCCFCLNRLQRRHLVPSDLKRKKKFFKGNSNQKLVQIYIHVSLQSRTGNISCIGLHGWYSAPCLFQKFVFPSYCTAVQAFKSSIFGLV